MGLEEIRKLKLEAGIPKPKKVYYFPKKSAKKIISEKIAREAGTDEGMDRWFEDRRKEMTGKCCLCGGVSEKKNDETYRRSIHHLFEKRKSMFPSVKTHPDNFLEVCFYGNSCHQNIHNGTITFELLRDSKEWEMIKEKLLNVIPFIPPEERKNKIYSRIEALVYGTTKAT